MCTTNHYVSRSCPHHWMKIRTPCAKDKTMENCDTFKDNWLRKKKEEKMIGVRGQCPKCDLKDKYDGKQIRLVSGREIGTLSKSEKIGEFNQKSGPVILCCVVM